MRNLVTMAAVGAVLLVGASMAPAAPAPQDVEFTIPTFFDTGNGTFTAAGPAVAAGLVCPSGGTVDIFFKASGFQPGPPPINFQIVKRFTCDDASGTLDVKLQVRIDDKGDNFNWTIVGGTGAYATLHGTGQGFGSALPPPYTSDDGVVDNYVGKLHAT